jgi:hypothetical protein
MKWSKQELSLLKENFHKGRTEVQNLLENRNWTAIKQKAIQLKLANPRFWTKEECDFLIENYSQKGAKFCAERLNKNSKTVSKKANKLGLKSNVLKEKRKSSGHVKDISGKICGYLVVESLAFINDKCQSIWNCKCVCGNLKQASSISLRLNKNISCGCKRNKKITERCYTGGKYISGAEFGAYKTNAKRRNHQIDMTLEDVENLYEKQNGKCSLSGIPVVFNTTITNGGGKVINGNASIDRRDNSKGYTKDNIQIVDKDVNMAKQRLSQQDFIDMCCRIADHQRNL